ncbi:hypothetical protein ABL975_02960 [Pseudomonas aeruginosa]|uniref:hypothetical protein n=1 Tax=Pseudomonas aeruginosa TaxID=287 RepID=UPI000FFC495B|nr:hypothetical protein [Pseudomonas aeruginosa]QMX78827.1 hypothetical protein H5J27_18750 [Pseudomonas aeruginosa]UEG15304.1 hypothetical protein LKM46_14685 [Pseudomonas aeruginosa]HCD9746658.1 hypothetical protein [Pseudomonas aeruginosa]HCE3963254.1 hypothetical protein [Pseudomonas aeruginosa]HCE4263559.1 hypothetical protein [Pseudomonas aeruginosa]
MKTKKYIPNNSPQPLKILVWTLLRKKLHSTAQLLAQFTCYFSFQNETWIAISHWMRSIKRAMKRLARELLEKLIEIDGPRIV